MKCNGMSGGISYDEANLIAALSCYPKDSPKEFFEPLETKQSVGLYAALPAKYFKHFKNAVKLYLRNRKL
jgi:hypothetical protein